MEAGRLGRRAWLAGAACVLALPSAAGAAETHPLSGQTVDFAVLGIADWHPSALIREMAPGFVAYAKERYGYDLRFRYEDAPFSALYEKAAASLAGKAAEFNLVVINSQWLGAFAAPHWILPLNPILEANKALDLEWFAPQVRDAFQLFPDGSNNRWALPQAGDTLVLFVRRDLLEVAGEAEAFKAKHGIALPRSWDDFEKLAWADFTKVLEFFDRPDRGMHGFASLMSSKSDSVSCPALSFILGRGGQVWDAKSGQVEGVLNTEANARALEEFMALLKYQPEAGQGAGIDEVTALFTQGKVFSALQWAGAGPSMIPAAMQENAMVVPPPGFRGADGALARNYIIGGQPWVFNDRNDDAHTQVAIDFMKWWYLPETALDFAQRGGLPCDKATLSRPDFDGTKPWFRAYKYMLERSSDFWHDPAFEAMLEVQQGALAALAEGKETDAKHVLDIVACRQQAILFHEGSAEQRPSEECRALLL